jgi:Methyltransferase domain
MKKNNISLIDQKHLQIIRKNVSNFIKRCGEKYDKKGFLLDIAPEIHEGANPYFTKITIHTLDKNPKTNSTHTADLCKNNKNLIPSNFYNLIVCTEVLEHTINPFLAMKELYRLLKKNGYIFITVPFNFRIHGPLPDCWRFTKYGIKTLLKDFEIIKLEETKTKGRWLMPIHYSIIAKKI